jgi:hypothetical protein
VPRLGSILAGLGIGSVNAIRRRVGKAVSGTRFPSCSSAVAAAQRTNRLESASPAMIGSTGTHSGWFPSASRESRARCRSDRRGQPPTASGAPAPHCRQCYASRGANGHRSSRRVSRMSEVRIGDIVLYHDPSVGGQVPAIIVKLESQESAWLNVFTIHGSVALQTPQPRGDQPGQWEPRPRG